MESPFFSAYLDHAQRMGHSPAKVSGHIQYMRRVTLYPPEQQEELYPGAKLVEIEVFAHGLQVLRIGKAEYLDDEQHENPYQEWLVQSLSLSDDFFITETGYPFNPGDQKGSERAYADAYEFVKNWYPAPEKAEHIEKWDGLMRSEEAVSLLLNSRAKLAEFWYESKVIDWPEGSRPFQYEYDVGQYLLSSKAFQRDPKWSDKEFDNIQTYAMNMIDSWAGDELKNMLIGTKDVPIIFNEFISGAGDNIELEYHIRNDLIVLDTKTQNSQKADLSTSMLPIEFPAIAGVRNIDDGDIVRITKALGDASGATPDNTKILLYADGSEGFFIAHSASSYTISLHDKAYLCDHERLLLDERKFKITDISFENEYIISVYEVKTYSHNESGEPDFREELIFGEKFTTKQLDGLGQNYGLMVPSSSSPADTYVWFTSASRFEKGLRTEYEMHLLEINGQSPTPAGLQRFANEMDITFHSPIKIPVFYIDDEVTGTPLEL